MKDNFIEFNINRFNYIKSKELPNLDFLTPIIRRRLNKHDKAILYLLNKHPDSAEPLPQPEETSSPDEENVPEEVTLPEKIDFQLIIIKYSK